MFTKKWVIGGLLGSFLMSMPAFAVTCSGTFFSETATNGGQGEDANACITINGATNTITVVLNNTTPLITTVPSLLDGFDFTLSGPTPTGISLTSVVASGFLDCTSGTCVAQAAFHDGGGSGTILTSPYEWAVFTGSVGAPVSQTYSLSDPGLFAGGGSLHPAAIINNNIGNGTHLTDAPHNDNLLGPVTFTFSYTGNDPTGVSAANFYWGTTGTEVPGGVPEPTSILLLGTALAFAGRRLTRHLAK